MTNTRPPVPPFTVETATQKVRMAEDGWNGRDPQKVSQAYTPDSKWRNRAEFVSGRAEIVEFLQRKWARELDYRLIKELWAFTDNRIAVSASTAGPWVVAPMITRALANWACDKGFPVTNRDTARSSQHT
ncbi:MAG: DUF1348 family protein, partial [Thiogranum sp.]|nr:DUF1348 family protein [Thiogranum sp.]